MTQVHDFYISNKLRVIEIPVGSKRPSATGWPDSNKTPEQVQSILDAYPAQFDKYGWVLDAVHVVIDIDVHAEQANGFKALEKLEQKLGYTLESVCGAIVETPSGGRHYYFTKDADTVFGKVFSEEYPGIDFINGKGKQVVAANSPHPTAQGIYRLSKHGDLTELPADVIEHLVELKKPKQATPVQFHSANKDLSGDEFNKSSKGLQCIIRELESRGYAVRAFKSHYEFDRPEKTTDSSRSGFVGQVSKEGNYKLICFSLSDKYFTPNESITIFHAYALLNTSGDHTEAASMLYDCGFAESREHFILPIDWAAFERSFAPDTSDLEVGRAVNDPGPFPRDCLLPPGFIGEVAKYTLATSDEPQPILALAGAMCLLSVLTGRKIRNQRDNRTNLFVLGLGPSGCGKDRPRKVNTEILNLACKPELIGANSLGSGHGIESQLRSHPCKLFQLDEIGDLLKAIKKERGSGHMESILQKIKMLMTSSHQLYSNAATADAKLFFTIDQPHLVIFGTATPEKFWDNLSVDSIEDGFLGRILPLEVEGYGDTQEPELVPVPQLIVDHATAWAKFEPGTGNLASVSPVPATFVLSEDARARHNSYCKAIDSKIPKDGSHKATDGLWKRARGRAASLALLFAASRLGPSTEGVIELIDVELSIKVINWITRRTIYKVMTQVSENQFQRDCNRVFELIAKGKHLDRTALTLKTRWLRRKERNEILEHLIESGDVATEELKTKTNTKVVFVARSGIQVVKAS